MKINYEWILMLIDFLTFRNIFSMQTGALLNIVGFQLMTSGKALMNLFGYQALMELTFLVVKHGAVNLI